MVDAAAPQLGQQAGPPADHVDGAVARPSRRDALPLARDFFVSYNHEDKAWAAWIAWELEAAGYTVYLQDWDFGPASNFVLEMQKATTQTRRTIAVLSPTFLSSGFTSAEWAAVFARDPTGAARLLVPVRVRECQPTGLLAPIVYIDLVGIKSASEGRERLIDGLDPSRPEHAPDMPTPAPGAVAMTMDSKPPWPPLLEATGRLVGGLLWRVLRSGAVVAIVALSVWSFFAVKLPGFASAQPSAVSVLAIVSGAVAALVVELGFKMFGQKVARSGGRP
jgi:hypothetical protein